jgi:hypothetical protein
MFCFRLIRPFVRQAGVLAGLAFVGCGSSAPVALNAVGEQALKEDMSRVADEERAHREANPDLSATSPAAGAATEFHPDESGQR